ncbi:hypothetical protein Tco_1175136 [Tanacetum coccineum]
MTTPRPTHFPATTPHRTPALYGYPLDSGDDSSDEDLSETVESLHTQTASTSVVHPPSTRPLPTSHAFAHRPRKEISMPLGYTAAMDRWRVASPSTCHPLFPSKIPSSSPPPSLLPSSLPLPPPSVSPSSLPSPPPPPPKHIESVGDDIETTRASLASVMQETMTLCARVGLLEQHNVVTRDSLRIARGRVTRSEDSEASRARAEAAEHQAETLHVSLRAARMDVKDLIDPREADRFEMAELRSRAQDIEEDKVEGKASNKRKWEGDHGGSFSEQQNKKHKVIRTHTTEPSNKKGYARNLPMCNKCKFYHTAPCVAKYGNCKRVGHQTRDCRTQSREQNRGPQWQNKKLKLPVMSVEETMAGVDVDTLTMEQYLALSRENQAPGMVKPKIRGNVNFEIKSQFMRELREDTFFGNKDEDAHDHIDRVLSIVGLFNILGVTKDAVML